MTINATIGAKKIMNNLRKWNGKNTPEKRRKLQRRNAVRYPLDLNNEKNIN